MQRRYPTSLPAILLTLLCGACSSSHNRHNVMTDGSISPRDGGSGGTNLGKSDSSLLDASPSDAEPIKIEHPDAGYDAAIAPKHLCYADICTSEYQANSSKKCPALEPTSSGPCDLLPHERCIYCEAGEDKAPTVFRFDTTYCTDNGWVRETLYNACEL